MLHPMDPVFITQGFGENPSVYAQFGLKGHNGLDYRTKQPDTPLGRRFVVSPYWGKIIEVGNQGKSGYGKFLRIEMPDGSQCVLGHLYSFKVELNDLVEPGQLLAISDNTGFSTAAHLHFGYRPPNWDQNNGYAGYIDQSAMLTSDLQKVLDSTKEPEPSPAPIPEPSQNFADQFIGKILVDVGDHGRKWFVTHEGKRVEIDKAPALELKLQTRPIPGWGVFIDHASLQNIPLG